MSEDHEIIHINDQESFMHLITEDVVHYLLEGAQAIAHSKEYNNWFVGPNRYNKCTLLFVIIFYMNIVVSLAKIHLHIYIASL